MILIIIIALISTILLLLAVLIVCVVDNAKIIKSAPYEIFIIFYSFIFSFIIFILLLFQLNEPTAIDVYKGKTTLEITYKDKVPVDSTVVWKK